MTDDLAAALARAERAEAELARYQSKPAPPEPLPTFTRTQLADVEYFRANKRAILRAVADGRIVEDPSRPDWRVSSAPTRTARTLAAARWTPNPKDGAK